MILSEFTDKAMSLQKQQMSDDHKPRMPEFIKQNIPIDQSYNS